jgi:hypothetical protein
MSKGFGNKINSVPNPTPTVTDCDAIKPQEELKFPSINANFNSGDYYLRILG